MRVSIAFALCLMACSSQSASNDGATSVTDSATDATNTSDGATDANSATDASDAAVGDVTEDTPQGTDMDAESSECNALSNVGAVVQQMYVASSPVTGDGGAISPGTYVLTAAAVYTGPDGGVGPTGTTFTDTLAMADGGTYERVAAIMDDAGQDGSPFHQNGRFSTDGGSIRVTQTCPFGAQPFTSYDSDGTRIRIYAPAGRFGPAVMFEYTRR